LKSEDKSKLFENVIFASQIGIVMVIPIFGGVVLGKYIDDKLGIEVVFLAIFTILGIVTSFISLFKMTIRGTKRK